MELTVKTFICGTFSGTKTIHLKQLKSYVGDEMKLALKALLAGNAFIHFKKPDFAIQYRIFL